MKLLLLLLLLHERLAGSVHHQLSSGQQADLDASALSVGPVLSIDSARNATGLAARYGWRYELSVGCDCGALFRYAPAYGTYGDGGPPRFGGLNETVQRLMTLQGRVRVVLWHMKLHRQNTFLAETATAAATAATAATAAKATTPAAKATAGGNVWRETDIAATVDAILHRQACPSDYTYNTKAGAGGGGSWRGLPSQTFRGHCDALAAHPVAGQRGVVIGSQAPWLEATLLAAGAASLTTIEYTPTTCVGEAAPNPAAAVATAAVATAPSTSYCERITIMSPATAATAYLEGELPPFDFAVSYSSIEHDGLGRYGDPVNPSGDLETIQRVWCLMKPGAIFMLGFPVDWASDRVVFNAHRVYGPLRLALATANFEVTPQYFTVVKILPTCGSVPQSCYLSYLANLPPHSLPTLSLSTSRF